MRRHLQAQLHRCRAILGLEHRLEVNPQPLHVIINTTQLHCLGRLVIAVVEIMGLSWVWAVDYSC